MLVSNSFTRNVSKFFITLTFLITYNSLNFFISLTLWRVNPSRSLLSCIMWYSLAGSISPPSLENTTTSHGMNFKLILGMSPDKRTWATCTLQTTIPFCWRQQICKNDRSVNFFCQTSFLYLWQFDADLTSWSQDVI